MNPATSDALVEGLRLALERVEVIAKSRQGLPKQDALILRRDQEGHLESAIVSEISLTMLGVVLGGTPDFWSAMARLATDADEHIEEAIGWATDPGQRTLRWA